MNDLMSLEDFRADAPQSQVSRAVRERALGSSRHRRTRRPLTVGIGLALAATATATLVLVQSGPGASPSAASELRSIARVVAADPIPEPRGDQWVYTVRVSGEGDGEVGHQWDRFDGRRVAYAPGSWKPGRPLQLDQPSGDDPRFVTPREYFRGLRALPDDARGVLEAMRRLDPVPVSKAVAPAARDYAMISFALTNLPLTPPDAYPKLFRALATIPGVGVDHDAAPDLLGRPVVAVTFDDACQACVIRSRDELLLDPTTYQVRGQRLVALEDGRFDGRDVHTGDFWIDDVAIVAQPRIVDQAGQVR